VPPVSFTEITNVGWALLSESGTPPDGVIDPGETVTVRLLLQNQGTVALEIWSPRCNRMPACWRPSGPQNLRTPGALTAGSPTKRSPLPRPGSCGFNILATLQLQTAPIILAPSASRCHWAGFRPIASKPSRKTLTACPHPHCRRLDECERFWHSSGLGDNNGFIRHVAQRRLYRRLGQFRSMHWFLRRFQFSPPMRCFLPAELQPG